MLKKSKGNRFHQQGFIFSTFPINFIICLTPYRKASITGAFFIKESEDDMGVRVVFPDMGKDPSVQLIEKTITENGTYDALTDGANGYSKVNVNVEGGGGSSDFSTAEVTFANNNSTVPVVNCICPMTMDTGEASALICQIQLAPEPVTVNAVLYKGMLAIPKPNDSGNPLTVEVTGNASVNGTMILITGDCTITIS